MEHSCVPSCNFTTFGNELWITAIRPIQHHEAISIDYGNFFYQPTIYRKLKLKRSYGFNCSCEACTALPDRTRAFVCRGSVLVDELPVPVCETKCTGIVCPYPNGEWKCLECQKLLSNSEQELLLKAEKDAQNREFESLEQVDNIIEERIIHPTHHTIFFALEHLGMAAASDPTVPRDLVIEIWERLLAAARVVVPTPHSEKVMYYDKLGQIRASLGDVNGAREAYGMAFQESRLVSGSYSETTSQFYELYSNPPTSRAETVARYAATTGAGLPPSMNPTQNSHRSPDRLSSQGIRTEGYRLPLPP